MSNGRKTTTCIHGHSIACSTVNRFSQIQLDGNKGGHQPHLRHKASLKAPLRNEKPCSVKDKAVNQLEEPGSSDNKTDLCKDKERDGSTES